MDPNRLKQGEQIAAGAAVVLFIVMFFDWFGAGGFAASAWKSFAYISSILAITMFTTLLVVGFRAAGRSLGDLPGSVLITVLGGLSTLLILYRVLDPIADADRKFGLFLGLIAAVGIAVGGYLTMQEEGTSFDDFADGFGGDGGGYHPPATPQGGHYQDPNAQHGHPQAPPQQAPPQQAPPQQAPPPGAPPQQAPPPAAPPPAPPPQQPPQGGPPPAQ